MALRGQGSLQLMLGLSFTNTKKRKANGTATRSAEQKNSRSEGALAFPEQATPQNPRPPSPADSALVSQHSKKEASRPPLGQPNARIPPRHHSKKPSEKPSSEQERLHLPGPPHGLGWTRIEAAVVGLRFRRSSSGAAAAAAAAAAATQAVTHPQSITSAGAPPPPRYRLEPEPTNPQDPNAIQVLVCNPYPDPHGGAPPASPHPSNATSCAANTNSTYPTATATAAALVAQRPAAALSHTTPTPESLVGYLPAAVSRHLAPWLQADRLEVQVHVDWSAQVAPGSVPLLMYVRARQSARQIPASTGAAAAADSHQQPQQQPQLEQQQLQQQLEQLQVENLTATTNGHSVTYGATADPCNNTGSGRVGLQPESSRLQTQTPPTAGGDADGGWDDVAEVEAALAAAAVAAAAWRESRGSAAAAPGEVLRRNFALMAEDVRRYDGHLLSADEDVLLGRLLGAAPAAQCLFLRLLLRRGPWFAMTGISYAEAGDVEVQVQELVAAGLAAVPQPPDWPQVAELVPVADLRGLLSEFQRHRRRPQAFAAPVVRQGAASILSYVRRDALASAATAHGTTSGTGSAAAIVTGVSVSATAVASNGQSKSLYNNGQSKSRAASPSVGRPGAGSSGNGSGGGDRDSSGGSRGGPVYGNGGGGGGKAAVIEALRECSAGDSELLLRVLALTGPYVRLSVPAVELLGRMQRLYFLAEGPAADMGRFLAADRGVIRYPPYTIRRSGSAFASRQQLLQYEEALRQAAQLEAALEGGDDTAAAVALQPALSAVRQGAARAVRWRGDATIPLRAVPGPWAWEGAAGGDGGGGQPSGGPGGGACLDGSVAVVACDGQGQVCVYGAGGGGGEDGGGRCDGRDDECGRLVGDVDTARGLCKAGDAGGSRTGAVKTREGEVVRGGIGKEYGKAKGEGGQQGGDSCQARGGAVVGSWGTTRAGGGCSGGVAAGCGGGGGPVGASLTAVVESMDLTWSSSESEEGGGGGGDTGGPWVCGGAVQPQEQHMAAEGLGALAAEGPGTAEEGDGGHGGGGEDDVVYGDEDEMTVGNIGGVDGYDSRCVSGGAEGVAPPPSPPLQHQQLQQDKQQLAASASVRSECLVDGLGQPVVAAAGAVRQQEPMQFLARFCSAWVYASMGTVGVSLFERQRRYGEAVSLLRCLLGGRCCPGRRGEWWMRMSVDLAHMGREEEALQVAEAALTDPWVRHGDRMALQRRVLRLGKPPRRWRRPGWAAGALAEPREVVVAATMLRGTTGLKSRFLAPVTSTNAATTIALPTPTTAATALSVPAPSPFVAPPPAPTHSSPTEPCQPAYSPPSSFPSPPSAACVAATAPPRPCPPGPPAGPGPPAVVTVEQLALLHYGSAAGGAWRGLHSEGGVWGTLWGLLMWDVMFADVPEVFRSPFQTAPLDLDTDAFLPARRAAIDARLQAIASGAAPELLRAAWGAHAGTWCRGVDWSRQPLEELVDIASCVGGLGLSVVCRLMAEDAGGWRGGMPDLLLWRPGSGEAIVSEVKGPRDRLSDQQRAWLAALSAAGVRAEVLRVVEVEPQEAAGDGDLGGVVGGGKGGSRSGRRGRAFRGRRAVAVPVAGGGGGERRSGGVEGREGGGGGAPQGAVGRRVIQMGEAGAGPEVMVISDDDDDGDDDT